MDSPLMMDATIERMGGTGHPAAINGKSVPPRRQYAPDLKRRMVEETFAPGQSVSIVARRHDVNANLLFDWRKQYRLGKLGNGQAAPRATLPAADLVRVGVIDDDGGMRPLPASALSPATPAATRCDGAAARREEPAGGEPRSSGIIEIELPNRVKVRVDAGIGEAALRRVLMAAGALP
jgi:transposase-like protein